MTGIEILKIGGIIAFLLPPAIAVITQAHWSPQLKGVVAFLVSVAAALAMVLYEGGFNWTDWRNASLVIVSGAVFFYHQFYKPSGIAPSIEAKTTPAAAANP